MGCYIAPTGDPISGRNFILWEVKADSFLHRGDHILLFSPEFIEIRHLQSGRLDQVIEGTDIRLLYTPSTDADLPLIATRGATDSARERIAELREKVETTRATPTPASEYQVPLEVWDEWYL